MDITNEQIKKGVLYAFIPDTLKIVNRPEVSFFPLNVMFQQYKTENNQPISGTAIYIPEIESFQQNNNIYSMTYFNQLNRSHWLIIEYNKIDKTYRGKKFVKGVKVFETDAPDWKSFFIHFTMIGLSNGETCEFKIVKP